MTANELKEIIGKINDEINQKDRELVELQSRLQMLAVMYDSAANQLKELESN